MHRQASARTSEVSETSQLNPNVSCLCILHTTFIFRYRSSRRLWTSRKNTFFHSPCEKPHTFVWLDLLCTYLATRGVSDSSEIKDSKQPRNLHCAKLKQKRQKRVEFHVGKLVAHCSLECYFTLSFLACSCRSRDPP